jgi:3-deoxy-D-manno-octulosonate 8-phosphate phosphatase (KDO 8-P phosphatase)
MTQKNTITVLALDVDGVLTDGKLSMSPDGQVVKTFHAHDGLGISLWHKSGLHTILISGRNETCVTHRAKELGIHHVMQGSKDKIADLNACLEKIGCSHLDVCFVGDDLGDIPIMKHVGYSIAVQNAVTEVKNIANWTTAHSGGEGAVRDAIEHLMKDNGTWDSSVSAMMHEHANQ